MITIRIFMRIVDPFSMLLLGTAITCSLASAVMLSASVVYALGIITGPHCDGKCFAPVVKSLLWKERNE